MTKALILAMVGFLVIVGAVASFGYKANLANTGGYIDIPSVPTPAPIPDPIIEASSIASSTASTTEDSLSASSTVLVQ
ncbi:MAG: hypothetical protein V4438_01595 [Patescibacteria group bacterium]